MLFRKTILSLITLFMAVSGMPVYAEEAPASEVTERKDDAAASTETESVLGIKKLYADSYERALIPGYSFNDLIKTWDLLLKGGWDDGRNAIRYVRLAQQLPSGMSTSAEIEAAISSGTMKDVSLYSNRSCLIWWDANSETLYFYSSAPYVSLWPDSARMFDSFHRVESIDVYFWKTDEVTDMSGMFQNCSSLTEVIFLPPSSSWTATIAQMRDLHLWDLSHVTNTSYMFSYCTALHKLDLSDWTHTSSIKNMSYMFNVCPFLTTLNVSSLDTSQVTDMSDMFYGCSKLTTLDLSSWNTSKVTGMGNMFAGCSNLPTLDLSGWDTSQVKYMGGMFNDCSSLTTIYIGPNWNADKVTSSSSMFSGCTNLHNFNSSVVDKTNANADQDTGYMEMADRFKVPYSVHFDKNAVDASGAMADEAFAAGEKKALTANSYVRDGFAFRSWNTKADGTGRSFADGAEASYLTAEPSITLYAQWKYLNPAYSHTSNIDDNGTKNSNYGNNWSNTNITGTDRGDTSKAHVITIPDAKTIKVTITYGGESDRYDYACVWKDAHPDYTASNNSSSSISGKLGGGSHTSASNTKTYTIEGDTVTFGFRSDGSGSGDGYGYYAVVEKVS